MAEAKRVLIRGGTMVTAADVTRADILVEGEQVVAVGTNLGSAGAEVVEAGGKLIFPGGIDPHTHLDMPFGGTVTADDFLTGTIAAAAGGTTTIVDFALQSRGDSLRNGLATWHVKAEGKAVIDYGFHIAVNDLNDQVLGELADVVRDEGVTSFKLFQAYKGILQVDDATILRTMQRARQVGALVMAHCENGDVIQVLVEQALAAGQTDPIYHALTRPPEIEGEATNRLLVLARIAGSAVYVVHLTCQQALTAVSAARAAGQTVFAETCPQYLVLDVDSIRKPDFEGAKYVWSPPLREKWHQDHLWAGLKSGSLQTLGSDMCSFNFAGQKELGLGNFAKIPNGGPSIEDRMSILYHFGVVEGRLSLNEFVAATSTSAARLFGLFPRKGTIAPGADADLVIWDPEAERTLSARSHHMNVDYNPFEGIRVKGAPVRVISRGETVVADGQFVGKAGRGRFIKRAPFDHERPPR